MELWSEEPEVSTDNSAGYYDASACSLQGIRHDPSIHSRSAAPLGEGSSCSAQITPVGWLV